MPKKKKAAKKTAVPDDVTKLSDLKVIKGARHCRIVDENGEIIFRTTNLRDAEAYLSLVSENRRLEFLLEARGIAPHRIYLLDLGDKIEDVVIVAKAGADCVVVRSLYDGHEQVVELEELKQLPEADYFLGTERPPEVIHVSVRVDRESDAAVIATHREKAEARTLRDVWRKAVYETDTDTSNPPMWSDKDMVIFAEEVVIQ
jgi:hypothetical protein